MYKNKHKTFVAIFLVLHYEQEGADREHLKQENKRILLILPFSSIQFLQHVTFHTAHSLHMASYLLVQIWHAKRYRGCS